MFRDRKDAGRRLAEALQSYRQEHPLVLALFVLVLSFGVFFWARDILQLPVGQLQTLIFVMLVFSGQATVYLVRDPQNNQIFALKVLPRQFTHDPMFRDRFARERAGRTHSATSTSLVWAATRSATLSRPRSWSPAM